MRSPKKKPFSKNRKFSKFRVTNWSEYNNYLRNRGRIDFMIAADLSEGWHEDHDKGRKRGGQRRYSDKAIIMCLQIRYLFNLKLRQTPGFIDWIYMMVGLPLTCPDYTTLSKRGRELKLEGLLKRQNREFNYICIDSTGIQTHTGNEWLENKHGKRYERRTWKKFHIITGDDGIILANSVTECNKDDRSQVLKLIEGIDAKELLGDPGYDGENIYQLLRAQGIKPTIRPPTHLVASEAKTERQQSAAYQQAKGYHAWRKKNGYGRRELVENTFFRFKNSFGSKFLSRDDDNMRNEMTIKCQLLNKMFEIGNPVSVRVA